MSDDEVDDYVEENVEKESSNSEHISETEDDLDVGRINSDILYHCDQLTSNILKRRIFLRTLAMSLIKPQVLERATMQNLPKTIRRKTARISGIPFVETEQNLPKKNGLKWKMCCMS
ncbi:hypothetical protein QTP88_003703 [Uroleucon formosanum]